jgi:uncharacterized protein
MFLRKIQQSLERWAESVNRKPLVLRGARQVGKTTAVRAFAKGFQAFADLNLELAADLAIFDRGRTVGQIWEAIRFLKGIPDAPLEKTLLFIDEIQKSPDAVALLRYFQEEMPALRVIAAGSLLETMLDVHVSFPVGRVEFMLLHPASFEEWLGAREETSALQAYREVPVPDYAHDKLEALFRLYLLTGGMPEAVRVFAETGDLAALDRIHESLIIAYLEDVEKYGVRERKIPVIRHVIQSALTEASGRIRYEGFGNSNYAGRDVKEAFDALQKAFLFQVIHPVTTTFLPLAPNGRKSPRLHALDTGLVVFKAGMRKELFAAADVSAVFAGRIIEHAVGQELYATSDSPLHALHFWARDKHQSSAEVDYVLPSEGRLIPIEVKAGATGRLRSLHAFMDEVSHATAVRLYGGRFRVEKTRTLRGKEYTLLNIPWYQSAKTVKYLERLAPAG